MKLSLLSGIDLFAFDMKMVLKGTFPLIVTLESLECYFDKFEKIWGNTFLVTNGADRISYFHWNSINSK